MTVRAFLMAMLLCSLMSVAAFAQVKVLTYFDSTRQNVYEEFFVSEEDKETFHGPYKRFYPNGKLAATAHFINGMKTDLYEEFYPNGQPKLKATFKEDVKNGPITVFSESGVVLQKGFFVADKLAEEFNTYYENGSIRTEGAFVNGRPEGLIKEYYPNGNLSKEIRYENNLPNGLTRTFYPTGVLRTEENYVKGDLDGFFKTYHPMASWIRKPIIKKAVKKVPISATMNKELKSKKASSKKIYCMELINHTMTMGQ